MSDPAPAADTPLEPPRVPAAAMPGAPATAAAAATAGAKGDVKIPLATASAPASPAANQARHNSANNSTIADSTANNNSGTVGIISDNTTVATPKPPAPAETRLNANAKSFTPSAVPPPPPPPPPMMPPAAAGGGNGTTLPPAQQPQHPPPPPPQQQQQQQQLPLHQPQPTAPKGNHYNNSSSKAVLPPPPPPSAPTAPVSAKGVPAMPNPGSKTMPMTPQYPPGMQPGKQPMMGFGPTPFPGAMPPEMMGGPVPGGYMMPQGFMPPPPGMQMPPPPHMLYGQPGGPPPQAVPGGMMWMPHPQQPNPQQPPNQPQQPGMPMNGMFPMPMAMPQMQMPPPHGQLPGHLAMPPPRPGSAGPGATAAPLSASSSFSHPPAPAAGPKAGVVPSPMPNANAQLRPPSHGQTPMLPQPQQHQQQQQHTHPLPGMMPGMPPPPGMMAYFQPPPGMMPPGMMPGPMMAPPSMQQQQQLQFQQQQLQFQQQQQQRSNTVNNSVPRQPSLTVPMPGCGNSLSASGIMLPPPPPVSNAAAAAAVTAAPGTTAAAVATAAASGATQARISVGNATLAALNSKEPPKFSCVLLSGIPAVGKTTLGRELVNSLKTDGMGWAFFSGADFLVEQQGKRSVWETTREVFDALSTRLDELLEQQRESRSIKGLVIDKNCKGIEDVYYLNALLRSKNIPFVGIVGLECADDEVLVRRMGGDDDLKEKLKFHRVIHARIVSLAKSAGMYRFVDATKSKDEVVQQLRTMVLGCCAQPPSRSIAGHQYEDSRANVMVDDYKEYSDVLTHLFKCVSNRGSQFPGSADLLLPFSTKEMTDKKTVNALKSRYGIRRKVSGNRYLLLYHEKKLYLVPPHMRAVLLMPLKAWLGTRLEGEKVGTFVLEGDLARLCHDRQKEMFLVYDACYWSEAADPASNTMLHMTFAEREAFLAGNMCNEAQAFIGADTECVVVHQPTQKMSTALDMLDSELYPSDGLVFQAVNPLHRSDHAFVWQQPSCLTVDFRVGRQTDTKASHESDVLDGNGDSRRGFLPSQSPSNRSVSAAATSGVGAAGAAAAAAATRRGSTDAFLDLPVHTFALEVYDKTEKMYVQYEDATVDVRHPDVVEGCIVTCSLVDGSPRRWLFRRLRYDVLRPIYKMDLDKLLGACLIPRAKLVSWLLSEQLVPSEIQPDGHGGAGGVGVAGGTSNIPSVPPPSYDAAAAAVGSMSKNAAPMGPMGGTNGTLFPPPPPPPPPPLRA
ncbi:hypothetical protein ABB37_09628, partial [Leptomonas pyrrhocoris]